MRMPALLQQDELPPAELSALVIDGVVAPLGDLWVLPECLDSPWLRARAALGARPPRLIAELRTAAWIWDAAPLLPATRTFCVDVSHRGRPYRGRATRVREVVIGADQIAALDGVQVTTPLRTALDLARSDDAEPDPDVLRALARVGGFGLDDCRAALDARRNLSNKRGARRRLEAALGR